MKDKITAYIQGMLAGESVDIKEDDDLLSTGLLDSISVMKLIAFLEEEFDVEVPADEMVIENFISVSAISDFLNSKK